MNKHETTMAVVVWTCNPKVHPAHVRHTPAQQHHQQQHSACVTLCISVDTEQDKATQKSPVTRTGLAQRLTCVDSTLLLLLPSLLLGLSAIAAAAAHPARASPILLPLLLLVDGQLPAAPQLFAAAVAAAAVTLLVAAAGVGAVARLAGVAGAAAAAGA